MKTIEKWLQEIKCPEIRARALANREKEIRKGGQYGKNVYAADLRAAIMTGFRHHGTPEDGNSYDYCFWAYFSDALGSSFENLMNNCHPDALDYISKPNEPRISGMAKFINRIENK